MIDYSYADDWTGVTRVTTQDAGQEIDGITRSLFYYPNGIPENVDSLLDRID